MSRPECEIGNPTSGVSKGERQVEGVSSKMTVAQLDFQSLRLRTQTTSGYVIDKYIQR